MAKKKAKYLKKDQDLVLIPDPSAQSSIIGSLKRSFSRSPTVVNFLKKHRREEAWFKKDGTKASRSHVYYRCAKCSKEFNSANIQVDHIDPVVPLNIPSKHLSYNTLIARLHCDESNLQILCKEHHSEKSKAENAARKEWIAKTKFIVYETVNRLNGKKYIGVHKCEDYDDFYLGSGLAIKSAIKKYGKDAFYRHIMYVYDNANDAYSKEKELVTAELIEDDNYYNLVLGGKGGFSESVVENNKIKLVCFETGQIFNSIEEASKVVGVSSSSISKALNNPNKVAKDLHFFTIEAYHKDLVVTYPPCGKKLIYLNTGVTYDSVEQAAELLKLNYKSLRNALSEQKSNDYYSLHEHCFLYLEDYDKSKVYKLIKTKIKCIELDKVFDTAIAAAFFLKHKNPAHGAIAINRAIRNGVKMYKYTWKHIKITIPLPINEFIGTKSPED